MRAGHWYYVGAFLVWTATVFCAAFVAGYTLRASYVGAFLVWTATVFCAAFISGYTLRASQLPKGAPVTEVQP